MYIIVKLNNKKKIGIINKTPMMEFQKSKLAILQPPPPEYALPHLIPESNTNKKELVFELESF